jgi:CRISPR-associated endonuclease/helicase Cas3
LFDPSIEGKRIVCVATQTFEVGLDADVEALVTESASASALVQRLGRLNRRGNRIGRATIIRDPGRWLYEEDEQLAWDWLSRRATDGVVDVSVAALSAGEPAPKPARRPAAPILSDEIVELLAQPTHALGPWQDLDVEVYWRGAESVPSADVSVCWRGDLRPELLGADGTSYRAMLLELVPPRAEELLTLTVNAARALVAAESLDDRAAASAGKVVFADVDVAEGTAASIAPDPVEDPTRIPFVVLRAGRLLTGVHGTADGGDRLLGVRAIRAGDVILLPARRSPRATGYETFPQTDVAADLAPKGMPAPVRLTPEALQIAGGGFLAESTWKRVASACAGSGGAGHNGGRDVLPDRLVERLAEILPDHPGLKAIGSETLAETRHHLMLRQIGPLTRTGEPDFEAGDDEDDADSLDPADEPEDDESIRTARRRAPTAIDRPVDASWVLVPIPDWQRGDHDRVAHGGNGSPPSLDAHARAVWAELEQSVERVGLSREVRGALRAAALAHDHGKADPRNQAYFRRGVRAIGAEVIAKSVFGTHDPRAHAIAMTLSGLPIGFRHEAESVAVFADAIESGRYLLDEDVDQELILVLILGHHGEGRSFARLPRGGLPSRRYFVDAGDVSGSSGGEPGDSWCDRSLERFWRVNGRYGAWGLAYLQALLMLADRSVSARGL